MSGWPKLRVVPQAAVCGRDTQACVAVGAAVPRGVAEPATAREGLGHRRSGPIRHRPASGPVRAVRPGGADGRAPCGDRHA